MKIQYLIVIFILILMPIIIVFSEYIDNQIETIKTEYEYDTRLLNSTYDAVKAYQLNTINNSLSDRPDSKIDDVDAAVNTFYYSLITSFGFSGYDISVMDEYIPAVIFCLYDGYYIYSPFENTTTGIDTDEIDSSGEKTYDQDYQDGDTIEGVKTYIYYNCHYTGSSSSATYDVTITYTLDNFITVEGYIGSDYVYKSGYLLDLGDYSIDSTSDVDGDRTAEITELTYNGTTYSADSPIRLLEYLGDTAYYYTKIDGTKFYYSETSISDTSPSSGDYIFYIDSSGEECVQVTYEDGYEDQFMLYYNAITENIDDFVYYRDAYNFTSWVTSELRGLNVSNGEINGETVDFNGTTIFSSYDDIQDSDSAFNEHRQQVIREVITSNLSTAITAYGNKYGSTSDSYIMPNISETDWELIENNVCVATFMQGLNIGGKIYNGYSVVANTLTKDYVDENDIYILANDGYYYKANDTELASITIGNKIHTSSTDDTSNYIRTAGVLDIDLERHVYNSTYYFPKSYGSTSSTSPYLGSYSSIIGSSKVNSISSIDMYRYMKSATTTLKTAYYSGLGRERTQCYNVQHGLFETQTATYGEGGVSEDNWYYLKNYFDYSDDDSTIVVYDEETDMTWSQGDWTATSSTTLSASPYTYDTTDYEELTTTITLYGQRITLTATTTDDDGNEVGVGGVSYLIYEEDSGEVDAGFYTNTSSRRGVTYYGSISYGVSIGKGVGLCMTNLEDYMGTIYSFSYGGTTFSNYQAYRNYTLYTAYAYWYLGSIISGTNFTVEIVDWPDGYKPTEYSWDISIN